MTSIAARLTENLQSVRQRMRDACARVDRDPDTVQLVAVTKYARDAWIRELVGLGVLDLGESRPQQLLERSETIRGPVRWHLVGHLQRNKVRKVLPLVAAIHSVDTWKLLERIELLAGELELRPRVLLEVNVSGEETKHGFALEELLAGWPRVWACRHTQVAGLMTMAPFAADPEDARPVFRRLCELRNELAARPSSCTRLAELSMGMSHDFEVAIEEGATIVRIGSDLFAGLDATET